MPQQRRRRRLTAGKRNMIARRQQWKCDDCGEMLPARFHIDHIQPLCFGGVDCMSNMHALDANCHEERTAIQVQQYWDLQRELRTGRSRYFDPQSMDYCAG